jgi:hypothetical protein
VLQQSDRRELERAGWRTTLEFRENNVRGRDGRLLQVEEIWHAEAERETSDRAGVSNHGVDFVHATAESVDDVWAKLRRQAELADVRRRAVSAGQPAEQAS